LKQQDEKTIPNNQSEKQPTGFNPIGIAIGVGIGLPMGAALGNIGVGLIFGVAFGIVFSLALGKAQPTEKK
jgi:hypothetical protein